MTLNEKHGEGKVGKTEDYHVFEPKICCEQHL